MWYVYVDINLGYMGYRSKYLTNEIRELEATTVLSIVVIGPLYLCDFYVLILLSILGSMHLYCSVVGGSNLSGSH